MYLPRSGRRMNKTAIAFGTFDGVHRGHREIINNMLGVAHKRGLQPMIYTFSNHPMELFGKAPVRIMRDEVRIETLSGIAPVAAERFDRELAGTSPEDFALRMVEQYGMKAAVAGFNYTFGSRGAGNMDIMRELGAKYGFEVYEIPACMYGGAPVSSTRIRMAIEEGRITDANAMLGYRFPLSGAVIKNRNIGRTMGLPTVNIPVQEGIVLPKPGVYAVWAETGGREYKGVTNIGCAPTVYGGHTAIETHIMDFAGEIYGDELTVRLVEYLRGEMRFQDPDDLSAQIRRDMKNAAKILKN